MLIGRGATEIASTVTQRFHLVAGETTQIDAGRQGRPVVGKLIPPEGYQEKVAWHYATISGICGLVPPPKPKPPEAIKNDPKEYEQWWSNWLQSPEGQQWLLACEAVQQQRTTAPSLSAFVNPEGIFRIDDVPAGVYNLSIRFADWPNAPKAPGTLSWQLIVPPMENGRSDEVLDLGTLQLN